jgi:predicted DNA-binding transcriptional regulator YafY
VEFGYSGRDGAAAIRRVEPHRLVQAGYRWYLVGRDLDRDDWRTFRADRIQTPRLTGVRFVPVDPPDAAAFVARAVTTAPYRHQARILVHAPAPVVAEHIPPTVGVLEPAGTDSCILTVGSDSLDALAFHTALLDLDFTVLAPPELAGRLAELAARLTAAARASDASLAGQPP